MSQLPNTYTTVREQAVAEFEEKRSVFIGHAQHVTTEEEAMAFIKEIKKEHRDATHNVFAYILGDGTVARYSDDGEPQGTAGMPALEALRKNGVTDVCVVVTRYFGGTLLGAGGLIRAYSHAATIAVEAAGIITYEPYDEISLRCGYSEYQKYAALLANAGVIMDGVDYEADVTVCFAVRRTASEAIQKSIVEAGFGKDRPIVTGERFDYR